MFKVNIYQMPSGRWRWKLLRGGRCVARADYHWATRSAARTAFIAVANGIGKTIVRDGMISEI